MLATARIVMLLILTVFVAAPHAALGQNRRVERADQAFELKQYNEALALYQRAFSRVNRKDRTEGTRILFQIAMCHRYTGNSRMAESWFNRAVRTNYPDPVAVLYLADAMMQNEKYEQALEEYERYSELVPDDWQGPRGVASAQMAMDEKDIPSKYEVEAVRLFNSRQDDYTPAFGDHRATTLIYASSRDDALGEAPDLWTGNQHTSFFVSYQDRAGDWSRPVLLDEGPVNTEYNEGAPSVNPSATEMFFTRCVRSPDVDMGCRIFHSQREGANWGDPREVVLVSDSSVTVGHPAISPDGLELYFSSDMPGGIGGKDLWVARRRGSGDAFGPPENLGPPINTKGNEMFPYVREDGSLFFSSDGHPGFGGLDIFVSEFSPDGWSEPQNMGTPVNSSADDMGIVFQPGREAGFLSSNRVRTGVFDLYSFMIPPLELIIAGSVLDDSTGVAVPNALVQLVGSDGRLQQVETDREGRFEFDQSMVRENTNYEILANKSGYFASRVQESTVGQEFNHTYNVEIRIAPIPDQPIELPEILYAFDSWELQEQFKDSLNGLVQTMLENPTLVIELASHTDARGEDVYNDTLSQRRAQAVVDYLVEEGIDPARLQARGYGKRQPRVLESRLERDGFIFEAGTVISEEFINSLPDEQYQDAAHQLNRRTEFRVLHDEYEPPEEEEDLFPPDSGDASPPGQRSGQ